MQTIQMNTLLGATQKLEQQLKQNESAESPEEHAFRCDPEDRTAGEEGNLTNG